MGRLVPVRGRTTYTQGSVPHHLGSEEADHSAKVISWWMLSCIGVEQLVVNDYLHFTMRDATLSVNRKVLEELEARCN